MSNVKRFGFYWTDTPVGGVVFELTDLPNGEYVLYEEASE